MPDAFARDGGLSLLYLAMMAVGMFYATVMLIVYIINRDVVALLYTLVSWSAAIITGSIGVLRSPHMRVDGAWLLITQRVGWVLMLFALAVLVDIYLAEHNGHLSIVRRVTCWWEKVIGYERSLERR